MKTLVLCRHAKSDWPLDVDDINRPLKPRGVNDATKLGKLLKAHDFMPDLIVSSPARRALTTAQLIANELGYETDIEIETSVYFGGLADLIAVIERLPQTADTVMIFGHNPTMEQAVRYFQKSQQVFEMPTSGMACFENYTIDWGQFISSSCRLRWLQVPRLKRKDT